MKTLALSELRRVAERTKTPLNLPVKGDLKNNARYIQQQIPLPDGRVGVGLLERIPWRVWYVAASNGDVIHGEECVTIAVYPEQGSRLVQFTASGQTRRLRDCCILQADDFILRV